MQTDCSRLPGLKTQTHRMRIPTALRTIVLLLTGFLGGSAAHASFHLMQIEQVIGGVNGDTAAQAIQLRMRSGGQSVVSAAKLIVVDAAGQNPVIVKHMNSNVLNAFGGSRVLIVSSNFTNYISSAIEPDFIMTQTIPASYLAAGRLLYEDDGGTIYWSVSWGGASYTGSQTGTIVNDGD